MFNTLYARLAAGLTVLLIAIGLLYAFLSTAATRHYLQKVNQQLNRNLAQNIVADRNLVAEGRLNDRALKKTFQLYMSINPSIEIYLLDLQGNITSYSADPEKIKRNTVSLAPIRAFLEMAEPYPLLGDDPRDHTRQKAFSVTPVPSKANPEGYLYVVLRGEVYDLAARMAGNRFTLRMSGWAVVISLLLGLLAGLLIFRLLTRRLNQLSKRMKQLERSGFESELPPPTPPADLPPGADEIDQLGVTFDRMAARIHSQIQNLTEQDQLRRRLVAQVSHDLRTPLAAMQGYLETLQIKGPTLGQAERDEYLNISLRQGRRLGRLVEELFELASLEAREKQPELMPFAVGELVSDAIKKHAHRARQENKSLDLNVAAPLPLAVGDLGMTERVLDNLLDNALAHTPRGGQIDVSISAGGGLVSVSVLDNGPGIAARDLPFVFEAFYRGSDKPGMDSANGSSPATHAGLGLAIANRIMALQKGDIKAQNSVNGGAELTFSLPQSG